MNLASILPCATVHHGGGTATAGATATPVDFLGVLAAQTAVSAEELPLEALPMDALPLDAELTGEAGEEDAAQDLLALAALASRAAHAALPQVLPTAGGAGDGHADGPDAAMVTAVDVTTTAGVAAEDVAVDTTVAAGDAGTPAASDAPVDEPDVHVDVADGPAVADGPTVGTAGQQPTAEASGAALDDAAPDEPTTTGPQPASSVGATGPTGAPEVAEGGEELQGQRIAAAPATPSERPKARAEAAPSRTGSDGVRAVDGDAATAPTQPGIAAPAAGRADALTPSSAAQRVLDLVTQLEDAPPPRVVVIETGEIRLRVGLDAGTVRLTVLGQLGQTGEEILRETTDALEAGGFDTELDRGTGEDRRGGRNADDRDGSHPAATLPARPAARSRSGIQL